MNSRKNEDRIGAKRADVSPPPMMDANDPLSYVAPTDSVELPSKGRFYPEDHPLHKVSELEIRQMTAKEEDILTSKSLLKQGVAIDRFLQNLIIDPRVTTDNLLIGDKNAVMVQARISGYGHMYDTHVVCPACNERVPYNFDLLAELERVEMEMAEGENYNFDYTENNTFFIDLPVTRWKIECRPLYGHDEKTLQQRTEQRKKLGLSDGMLIEQMRLLIVSMNGVTDEGKINRAISDMPAIDSRTLRQLYAKAVPNIDLKRKFDCPKCNEKMSMEVPLTAEFFWPRS